MSGIIEFHISQKFYLDAYLFQPFQPAQAPLTTSLAGWMANPSSVPHQTVSVGPIGLTASSNAGNACFL